MKKTKNRPVLRAGAARVDITPDLGIQLAGDIGRYRPTEEIRDRLYANALVLESGGKQFCLLSLDLLASNQHWADRIRQEAGRRFGLDPESIMVHVVQNHASPALGHCFVSDACRLMPREHGWLLGGDDRYHAPCARKCVAAIGAALKQLEPVTLQIGRGIDGRVAFNRRFVMRDGTALTHPRPGDLNILHAEGPTDPEVGVATLTNAKGRVVAALLHHTCHPCHGYPHRYVIGDWPGAWAERMREQCGESCVPLVINGCCGNIHHANHLDPDWAAKSNYRDMAGKLMETTQRVLGNLHRQDRPELGFGRTVLTLPLRKLTADVIQGAEDLLRRHPKPQWVDRAKTQVAWDWVYAVMILDLRDRQRQSLFAPYEIQVFRIGEWSLVTLMGEPFVEAQLRIKRESPAPYTWVAHFCNGYAGYVPTETAFRGGGYETRTSNGSKWSPSALHEIEDAAIALLRQVCVPPADIAT